MNRLSPSDIELSTRLSWFVKLRWLFVFTLSALLFFSQKFFDLKFDITPIAIIAAIVLLYNIAFFCVDHIRKKNSNVPDTSARLRLEANLQIGLDLVAMVFLVHFSGGIENPFAFFFVFHMIIGSILLSGRDIWFHAVLTIFALMTVLGLSVTGIIVHHRIEGFGSADLYENVPYVFAASIAFSTTMIFTVYMTHSISKSVWKRENELIAVNSELEEKSEEVKYANRELIKQQQLLIQSEKLASLGKLSAGVAHELNNPLTGIINFAYFIRDYTKENPQLQYDISVLIRETMRCKKIINGLLDFARQNKPERKKNSIIELLFKTTSLVKNHKDFRDVEIIEDYDEDIPELMFDKDQIQQVFMNLIVNAEEAMHARGTLYIRAKYDKQNEQVEIKFKDTGGGIDADSLNKIFDPFFTTKEMGTGLGLSISMGIIENHHGKLTVESSEGEGATFTVCLPVNNINNKES